LNFERNLPEKKLAFLRQQREISSFAYPLVVSTQKNLPSFPHVFYVLLQNFLTIKKMKNEKVINYNRMLRPLLFYGL
jgi:hypothetical protein